MKIVHFKRSDIIDDNWNAFLHTTPQNNIYAKTWYLDQIPQEWKAIGVLDNEMLVAVLPYQVKKKYGIEKVEQDAFTNELGIFHLKSAKNAPQLLLDAFFKKKFISRYYFNTHSAFLQNRIGISPSYTHHLNLNLPIEDIRKNYSVNLRRNLKKAQSKGVSISVNTDLEQLILLFKENVASKISGIIPHQYDILRSLYQTLKSKGLTDIYGAYSPSRELLSAALVVYSEKYLIYFFAASSYAGKAYCSQPLLIDQVIKQHANTNSILDFEGGNTAGLKRFYASFGSSMVIIPQYRKMYGEKLLNMIKP